MTMQIVISNEDEGRTATVSEEEYKIGELVPASINLTRLAPKASKTYWIHAAKRIVISEIPGDN